jgi:hypothetical protein
MPRTEHARQLKTLSIDQKPQAREVVTLSGYQVIKFRVMQLRKAELREAQNYTSSNLR